MASISAASGEEEACSEAFLIIVFAGDRTGDCGLSCAGQPVQPEDPSLIFSISPCLYLMKDISSGAIEASVLVLLAGEVEGGLRSKRQLLQ